MLNPRFSLTTNNDQDLNSEALTDIEDGHPFLYAKLVIQIFDVNVIYVGEGNRDHHPRRLEFLWVRLYQLDEEGSWDSGELDHLRTSLLALLIQTPFFVDVTLFPHIGAVDGMLQTHAIGSLGRLTL